MTSQTQTSPGMATDPLRGAAIIDAVKAAGVRFVVALPDIVTCESVLWPMSRDPDLKLVTVCKEDEGVSICAGLSYCDARALLLMQHTGLLDSINALRAIGVEYGLHICMMVGLQGMEPDRAPRRSDHLGIRIVEPILETMGVDTRVLGTGADVVAVAPAIDHAYRSSRPLALVVARSPV